MPSFREQTSSFFDELTNIIDAKKKAREKDMQHSGQSPFSNQLTQDEEPSAETYNPHPIEETEPEVIMRGG